MTLPTTHSFQSTDSEIPTDVDRSHAGGQRRKSSSSSNESIYSPVLQVVKDHPGPVMLLAAGLGWLAYSQQNLKNMELQAELNSKLETLKEQSSEKVENLSEYANDVVENAKDKVVDEAYQAREAITERALQAKSGLQTLQEENPLAIGGLALLCGIAVGLTLPSTRREDTWMGDTRERVANKVKTAVHDTKQAAVESIKSKTEDMKDAVSQARDTVRDKASEMVEDVKETARGEKKTHESSST